MQVSEPTGEVISVPFTGRNCIARTRRNRRCAKHLFGGPSLIEPCESPRPVRRGVLLFPVFTLVLLAGCASAPQHRVALTGDIMVDGPRMIANGPPRDRVLWQYRTAAAAMYLGLFPYARQLLDDALLTVGGASTDRSAKLARSYFHPESTKAFIGEPYERVMAFYYRGILYWMDGEPDNARACFRSAQIQDADAEEHKYAADYALLDYLDGLASTKLAADGADAYQRAESEARLSRPPPYDAKANVLFFVEWGAGPFKHAAGQYREELHFQVRPSPVQSAAIEVNGRRIKAGPFDDLYFQATTRGGRVMDHVLANKAVFKSTTSAVGDAALISGAILAGQTHHNSAEDEVGLGLLAAGILTKLFSAATVPAADTRAWENLPRYLSFASLSLPTGRHTARVEFMDQDGHVLPGLTKIITFDVSANGKDTVLFVSDKSLTHQTV